MNARDSTLSVSVLMPAGKMFDEVFLAVAACCREVGARCDRVEAQFSREPALARVHSEIARAELVIADITAKNPNVMYEVGYAHAVGKKVILLAQQGEDLPFDTGNHRAIIYAGNLSVLKQGLLRALQQDETVAAGQAKPAEAAAATRAGPPPALEKFQSIFGDILEEHTHRHEGNIYLEDEKTFVLEDQDFSLALVQALVRRGNQLGIRLKLL